jgi:hypothetical protein
MASRRRSEIRELAYKIWLEDGCPHGRDLDHWLRAEGEVTLLDLHRGFQQVRRPLNHLYPMIGYDDSFLSGHYNPFSLIEPTPSGLGASRAAPSGTQGRS